jgi:mannan endo-1,4-beta-mannosidase
MQQISPLRGALVAVFFSLTACGGASSDGSSAVSTTGATATAPSSSVNGSTLVALSSANYTVPVSTASAVVTVYRVGTAQGAATVSYSTANGTATAGADYVPTSGTLSWAEGDTSSRTIAVPVSAAGANKQFAVNLVAVAGAASLGSPASATVTLSGTSSSSSSSGATSSSSSGGKSASGTSSSSSSSGATSSSSSASGSAASLLNYLNGLSGQTKHILSGQHSSYWDSNPLDYEQAATSQTGKTVAILGTTSGQEGSTENTVSLTNSWLAQGGIPLVSWWPLDPFTGQADNDRSINFAQLTQPGTAAYIAWYKLLDAQIAMFKQIKGPVLYRPLLEMNGNWSWWGDQPTAEMITVWQQMHDYFVSQGVTNVLWVFNVNSWTGNYTQYYPGAAYVDVVSWDAYPPTSGDPTYTALASLGKPVMLAETGVEGANNNAVAPFSGDNSQLLATVKANFPKVIALVIFCQNWALSEQNGAAALMNDPATIAMSDLPSGLVDP